MAVNYIVDPIGYFAAVKGTEMIDANGYTRVSKSQYVVKHADEIDAIVLGGSKSGDLSTELLTKYTGYNYYNFYISYGCFSDYLIYAKYLIDKADLKEITLHLSSIEAGYFSKEDVNEIYCVPAFIDGNIGEIVLEKLNYLCRNISSSIDTIQHGEESRRKNGEIALSTGEKSYAYPYSLIAEDPISYASKYVTNQYQKNLKSFLDYDDPNTSAVLKNVQAMKDLVALCNEKDVTLKVVIGPAFLTERRKFECEAYYDYLRELVKVVDIWDFSDYNRESSNPYNFINEGHFNNDVADLMINTMYGGESREGFGQILTQENIEEYLTKRAADYAAFRAEFEETGTVVLPDMDDSSYIPCTYAK